MQERSRSDLESGSPSLISLDYQRVLDALADPVLAADTQNRVIYANRAAEEILGWPADQLLGQPLVTLVPERLRSAHTAGFNRFLTTGKPRIMGHPIRVPALRRDGTEIDVELVLSAVRPPGEDLLLLASIRDFRDRVELEQQVTVTQYLKAATDAAARLTSLLDVEHVLRTVVETQVDDFGAALARIWLYEPGTDSLQLRASAGSSAGSDTGSRSRLGLPIHPHMVEEVARTRRPWVKNDLQEDPLLDQEWVHSEGIVSLAAFPLIGSGSLRGVLVHFSRVPLPDGLVEILTQFSVIVTTALNDVLLIEDEQRARTRAEDAHLRVAFLAEATQALSDSLDYGKTLTKLADLIVPRLADWCSIHVVEEAGTVQQIVVAHIDPDKIRMAQELGERYPFDPDAEYGVARALRTGQSEITPEISEELIARLDLTPELQSLVRDLGLRSSMIVPLVARERTLGAITFVTSESAHRYDASDLTFAEELARRAAIAIDNARLYHEVQESIRMRDELLSSISHDLKNPLTALKAQAQVLQRRVRRLEGEDSERLDRGLENIVVTASKMNRLINDLVDVAHLRAGRLLDLRPEEVNLVMLAQQMADEYQQTTDRHQLSVKSPYQTLIGVWDGARLERVLGNLLSNAIKYSPDGGDIVIDVDRTDLEEGSFARLKVSGPGLGIPAADLPRVFQRFQRGSNVAGKIAGTGIGLAGSKQIVEQHGGTITVNSLEGEGATFDVVLPLAG